MLSVSNPFNQTLMYDAMMFIVGKNDWIKTSILLISQLKHAEIIENIQEMLGFEMGPNEYILNNAQRKRIAEAQEEYKMGAYLTEDEANKNLP